MEWEYFVVFMLVGCVALYMVVYTIKRIRRMSQALRDPGNCGLKCQSCLDTADCPIVEREKGGDDS